MSQGKPRLHALRDSDAFAELAAVLNEQSYVYNGLILNFPVAEEDATEIPTLGPSDLLVLTTRPPLNDDYFDRRFIKRSDTELEKSVLKAVGCYFNVCRRSRIVLSQRMVEKLKFSDRGEIEFTMYGGASYRRYRMPGTKNREQHKWQEQKESIKTAAFALLTNLWKGGPSLLNAFGMDGPGTLIWCYLLRTRFAHLLKSPRFIMAEITTQPLPQMPPTLAFAEQWDVDLLLNHPLDESDSAGTFQSEMPFTPKTEFPS
ncbi:MAG: hypothetical protein WAV47_03050 [Blastocatellia bacterium]